MPDTPEKFDSHRMPDMPFWHVPKGRCRWCGDFIWQPDDTLNLRRRWHPHCVDAYKEAAWPQYARKKVYQRDKGRCAHCGKSCRRAWELDHIVPLIDGGGCDLSNMQTLCRPCHRKKTGKEATQRAQLRQSESVSSEETSVEALTIETDYNDEMNAPWYCSGEAFNDSTEGNEANNA